MKQIIYIFIFISACSTYSQRQGGQRGGMQNIQGQERREPREFKTVEAAGLIDYDVEKVVKKLKLKNDKVKAKVITLLNNYNFNIKEITLVNAQKIKDFDVLVNAEMRSRRNSAGNDNSSNTRTGNFRQKIQEFVSPLRAKVRDNESVLNAELQALLNEKQHKKWMKFQKAKKEKLKPQRNSNNNNQRQNQRGNNRRRMF